MNRLIAVVTGGARGIGSGIAESLKEMVLFPQIGNVQDVVRAFECFSPFVAGVTLDVKGGYFMI